MKTMKIKVTGSFKVDVSDWYEDERLTKKEKLKRLEEDFNDIEVFCNHVDWRTLLVDVEDVTSAELLKTKK